MDLIDRFETFDSRTTRFRSVIDLRIDELILDGFDLPSGKRIGIALERELSRLISMGGLKCVTPSPIEIDTLNAGSFHIESDAHPIRVGKQIAQRVYDGLARARSTPLKQEATEGTDRSHA